MDEMRYKLVMAGERAGKSFTGAAYGAAMYMSTMISCPEQLGWMVGYDYETCMPEFTEMSNKLMSIGILNANDVQVRDGGRDKCRFTTSTGLTVETISGSEPHKISRLAPNFILGCEVGHWTEAMWHNVIGRLMEKRGCLWASGSFESNTGWLVELWRKWQGDSDEGGRSYSIPSWANPVVYPLGEEDPEILRRRAMLPPWVYEQRHLGIPSAPKGMVFTDFLPSLHISPLAVYDPSLPMHIFIDPGNKSAYAVLAVQFGHKSVVVVDEIYERDRTNAEVIAIACHREWWPPSKGVIDVAGTQHHGERSSEEAWREAGVRCSYRHIKVEDGIDRLRSLLRSDGKGDTPTLLVHPRCRGLIAEMGAGQSPFPGRQPWCYKTDAQGNVLSEVPDDRNNDACKALYYGLIANLGYVERRPRNTEPVSYLGNVGPKWYETESSAHRSREKEFWGR